MSVIRNCLLILGTAPFLAGCASSSLIHDQEYNASMALARQSLFSRALEEFPKKESGGFVTSVEKNWLGFWANHISPGDLERQVQTFEQRKFISLSREAQYFFFQESEEGYVPAEHEVIVLHLLSAMSHMRLNQWEDAKVEARRAGYYLQGLFNESQPHFDSPSLRLWLAAIWTSLGEWSEAQVDLKRASEVTNDPIYRQLAERKAPPEHLNVIFYGVGPALKWRDGSFAPEFLPNDSHPLTGGQNLGLDLKTSRALSTHEWYVRHVERNSAIRDSLLKSNYMSQFIGLEANVATQRASTKVAASTVKVFGVALGLTIAGAGLYVLTQTGGGQAADQAGGLVLGAAFGVGSYFWTEAEHFDRRVQRSIDDGERIEFEKMRTYRFVRFMPDWIVLNWESKPLHLPQATAVDLKATGSNSTGHFFCNP